MKEVLKKECYKKMVPAAIVMLIMATQPGLHAQAQQQEAIEASNRVSGFKTELSKLQNELSKATQKTADTARAAKSSAEANRKAAEKLAANPGDKSLSSTANKLARTARQDARSARKAAAQQASIEKEITKVQQELSQPEAGLVSQPSLAGTSATVNQAAAPAATERQAPTVMAYPSDPVAPAEAPRQDDPARRIADKVIEQTYKSYPQQAGQPTIIINNIVVPPDYNNHPVASSAQPLPKPGSDPRETQDIEALKVRLNQLESMLAANQGKQNSAVTTMAPQPAAEPAGTTQKLTFAQRFGEVKSRRSGLWVIPMVGVHASNFEADFADDEAKGRSGWNAGLDFRAHQKRFFIQPGVHYFSSSMDVTSKDSLSNAPLLKGPRIHSLKVPLLLGIYLTREQGAFLKVNLKGGATGTYVLAVDKNMQNRFTKDNIEEFSYGLNAGLGIELGLLTIDLSHEWGMSPLFKDDKSKSNVLRATIGIKI